MSADMYVRLPLAPAWAGDLLHEMTWLPRLAPRLSVPIPEVLAALHEVDPHWLEPLDTQFDRPLLAAMDDWIRESVDKASDMIDPVAVLAVWDSAWAIRAVGGLDYYRHSNPRHVANCLAELHAVLADVRQEM